MIFVEILAFLVSGIVSVASAIAFVLSSGHLFKDRFKNNRWLIGAIAVVSIISTVQLYDPTVKFAKKALSEHWPEAPTSTSSPAAGLSGGEPAAAPAPPPPEPAPSGPAPSTARLAKILARLGRASVYVSPDTESPAAIRAQIARRPNDADLWHSLAQSLWRQGRFDDAIEAFRKAAGSPPRYIGRGYLFRDLAEALEVRNRPDEALRAARKMLVGWPVSDRDHACNSFETRLFVRLLLKNGQTREAADIYAKIAAAEPDDVECGQISSDLAALI